jgi:hypothetical protein
MAPDVPWLGLSLALCVAACNVVLGIDDRPTRPGTVGGVGGGSTGSGGGAGGTATTGVGVGGSGGGVPLTGTPLTTQFYPGGAESRIFGLAAGDDGRIYAAGFLSGSIAFSSGTLSDAGGDDALLLRLDTDLVDDHAEVIGGVANQQGRAIALAPSNNRIFMAGRSTAEISFGATTVANALGRDAVLLGWDNGGTQPMPDLLTALGNDESTWSGDAVAASPSVVAIGGVYQGAATIGSHLLSGSTATEDALVVAMDAATGTSLWADGFGSDADDDAVKRVAFAPSSDELLVVGSVAGNDITIGTGDELTLEPGPESDGFLIRYDPNTGEARAAWSFGAAGTCVAWDVAPIDNDLVVVGEFQAGIFFETASGPFARFADGVDALIARLGPNDEVKWALTSDAMDNQEIRRVAVDSQGHVVVAGTHRDAFELDGHTFSHTGDGMRDLFVAKLDGSGKLLWGQSFGGSEHDELRALAIGADDSIYVGGHFLGTLDFGAAGMLTSSTANMFLAKLAP